MLLIACSSILTCLSCPSLHNIFIDVLFDFVAWILIDLCRFDLQSEWPQPSLPSVSAQRHRPFAMATPVQTLMDHFQDETQVDATTLFPV